MELCGPKSWLELALISVPQLQSSNLLNFSMNARHFCFCAGLFSSFSVTLDTWKFGKSSRNFLQIWSSYGVSFSERGSKLQINYNQSNQMRIFVDRLFILFTLTLKYISACSQARIAHKVSTVSSLPNSSAGRLRTSCNPKSYKIFLTNNRYQLG